MGGGTKRRSPGRSWGRQGPTIRKLARFEIREDATEEALDAIQEFVAAVDMNEPGTLAYVSFREHEAPTRFVHYMVFEDAEAEKAHRDTDWVASFVETLYPLCTEEPTFVDIEAVAGQGLDP